MNVVRWRKIMDSILAAVDATVRTDIATAMTRAVESAQRQGFTAYYGDRLVEWDRNESNTVYLAFSNVALATYVRWRLSAARDTGVQPVLVVPSGFANYDRLVEGGMITMSTSFQFLLRIGGEEFPVESTVVAETDLGRTRPL